MYYEKKKKNYLLQVLHKNLEILIIKKKKKSVKIHIFGNKLNLKKKKILKSKNKYILDK